MVEKCAPQGSVAIPAADLSLSPFPAGLWTKEGGWSPKLQKTKVYEHLCLDIILGHLAPGHQLDEQLLAERYGCGLAGVREALGRLALEGMVVRKARTGTSVAPIDLREIQQAFEVRYLLEGRAAALAAEKADAEDIRRICTAFDGAEAVLEQRDLRALMQMDQTFHRAVLDATKNRVLARQLLILQNFVARFWIYTLESSVEQALADVELHRRVAGLIAKHDMAGAEQAMLLTIGDTPFAHVDASRTAQASPSHRVSS